MTDEQLATQILQGVKKSSDRFERAVQAGDSGRKAAAAEYLSGASQASQFLIRLEGEVTPQQMTRALSLAGELAGFNLSNP